MLSSESLQTKWRKLKSVSHISTYFMSEASPSEDAKGLLIQWLRAGCHRMLPWKSAASAHFTQPKLKLFESKVVKRVVKHTNRSINHQDNPRTNYHQTISLSKVRSVFELLPKHFCARNRNKPHFLLKGNTEKEGHPHGLCCLRKSSTAQLLVAKIFGLSTARTLQVDGKSRSFKPRPFDK